MVQVYKFGGTCTESPEKLDRITKIISTAEGSLVVTLSAAAGVTNQLKLLLESNLDESIIKNGLQRLKQRHLELADNRFELPATITDDLERLERLLYGIYYTEELTDRTHDLVMTFGERLIAPILQNYLQQAGLTATVQPADQVIRTNGQFRNALVLLEETEILVHEKIDPLLDRFQVVIVPGFYGTSADHFITILGRSGTDYTATALAHGLQAEGVTIWKDVLGFMSADPRLVPSAHTIPFLSYQEAAELAYFGAKLLHPRAASPARIRHIPIYIRHIDDLEAITCINSDASQSSQVIKSVSHMTNLAIVKVYASVGGNTRGVLARIAAQISEAGGNTISVATSQTCIAFLMQQMEADISIKAIEELKPDLVDYVEVTPDISLLCVVGEGLGSTPGIASQVFEAVSAAGINVELISAGASSTAYHFTVSEQDLTRALQLVHNVFFEESP